MKTAARNVLARIDFSQHRSDAQDSAKKERPIVEKEEPRIVRIFICYATPDRHKALQLYACLKRVPEFEPWINTKKIPIGGNWSYETENAIKESDFFVACVSSESVHREGDVQRELKIAEDRSSRMPQGFIFIMPIRLDECTVPASLTKYHYDYVFKPVNCERLIESIQTELMRREERDRAHSLSQ